jgi:trigger factor
MNVNTTKTGDLTATITLDIKESDYQEKVSEKLKDYRKKANIPGFRPGKVPAGLIRKQYGKAILIEEVNHILQHAVYDHIQKEGLDILGNPIPVEQTDIDWDEQKDFSFDFEIGISPEIDITIDDKIKVPYLKIEADDAMIDRYVNDYAKRFGTMTYPEKADEHGIVKGKMQEVGDDASIKEDGIQNEVTVTVDSLSNMKPLIGSEIGDTVSLKVSDFKEDFNLANLLGVEKAELEASSGTFNFEITELSKLEPAEVNQELFDKVFGEGKATDEATFRALIKADAEKMFIGESERKFYEDVKTEVLKKTKFDLPADFLKKWMQQNGEKPLSQDEAETQYPEMEEGMKWQLVENKVIKEHNVEVSQEDIIEYTKELVRRQMAQYGQMPDEAEMDNIAKRVLENRDEVQRITDQLYSEKLVGFFKENVKLKEKKLSFDDFIKEVSGK